MLLRWQSQDCETQYISSILASYARENEEQVAQWRSNLLWVNGDIRFDMSVLERRGERDHDHHG